MGPQRGLLLLSSIKTPSQMWGWLCVPDSEDGRVAGGGAVQGGPSGGIAQRGDDGGAESCRDRALPRGQGEGAGDHKRLCQR